MRRFATTDEPLRASALTDLQQCAGMGLYAWRKEVEQMRDDGSRAADTGTAVGLMVELFHRGDDPDRAVRRTRAAATGGFADRHPFGAADLDEAERAFLRYAGDPRNSRDLIVVESLEKEVTVRLPAHPQDPTGEDVVIVGHIDQVRRAKHGVLEVWDLKHSRFSGDELLRKYFFQQAAYTVGAHEAFEEPVRWGGILRTKGYLVRDFKARSPDRFNVFYKASMSLDDCRAALDVIRYQVALIRRGDIAPTPGVHCQYCPAKSFSRCRRELSGIFV